MLADKLSNYKEIRAQCKYKTIEVQLGNQVLTIDVRVPLKGELEELNRLGLAPTQERLDAIKNSFTKDLKESFTPELAKALRDADSDLLFDDQGGITYKGENLDNLAFQLACWHVKVEQYFSLLKSATGEPINESYEEIAAEFTEEQIRNFVQAIHEAISPSADSVKKS